LDAAGRAAVIDDGRVAAASVGGTPEGTKQRVSELDRLRKGVFEGRHALARKIFHGKAGQLYQCYQDGIEDQIGALGLMLNALVLFNTRYMDAAVQQLREDGFDVGDEDVARLSPFVRHHINMLGRYSFQLPELPGSLRPLRDPDATDDE
jgi:hypothetical protein